jgi:predicted dienelactone hydrolase
MCQALAVRWLLFFAIAMASWLAAEKVQAGGLIEFPNLEQGSPAQLLGYLARPDQGLPAYLGGRAAAAPYPAVVVLHGCSGFSGYNTNFADQIASWGYVVLAIDSLNPRGIASRCSRPGAGPLLEQALDAYAALRYLSRLDFVDPERVAVLGGSMGGFPRFGSWDTSWSRNTPSVSFALQLPITRSVAPPKS